VIGASSSRFEFQALPASRTKFRINVADPQDDPASTSNEGPGIFAIDLTLRGNIR